MTRTSELVAIGARDIIPPEGRVMLELRSGNTGRLRKRVVVENALMDWYKAAALRNGGRGSFEVTTPSNLRWSGGVNPLSWTAFNGSPVSVPAGNVNGSLFAMSRPGAWPILMGVTRNMTNWLWASNASTTPDATKAHIPTVAGPEVTAGVKINTTAFAADGIQNKRGNINSALSYLTWDQIRMVCDFSTAEGNGTYRSIGIGNLVNQILAPGGLRPFPAAVRWENNSIVTSTMLAAGTHPGLLANAYLAMGKNDDFWVVDTGFALSRRNVLDCTSSASGALLFTVSAGNVPGSGGPNGPVIEQTASDFWVARNQVLYRCVAPTSNVAMTVTNTYNLAATLGAEAIEDITFDGTNLYLLTTTKVYVVDPATGASTSNWAHGRTGGTAGYPTIMWDAAEQLLWINFIDRTNLTNTHSWGSGSGSNQAANPDTAICYGYTTAGSITKWHMGRPSGSFGASGTPARQLLAPRSDGLFFMRIGNDGGNTNIYDWYGPSMATHALLPSDVVKTSSDVLRITYDFNFS